MSKRKLKCDALHLVVVLLCCLSQAPVAAGPGAAGQSLVAEGSKSPSILPVGMGYGINETIFDRKKIPVTAAEKEWLAERQFYEIGMVVFHKKDFALLKKQAQKCIQNHPHWCAPFVLMGRIACEQFEDDEAIVLYKKGAEVSPACTLPLKELAFALHRNTDYRESIVVVDKALKLIEKRSDLENRRARGDLYLCKSYAFTGLKRYDDAVSAMELSYQNSEDYSLRGPRLAEAYINAKQYGNVVKLCTAYLKEPSALLEYYYFRGIGYSGLGQDNLAINDLNKFIQRNNSTIAVTSKDRLARTARALLYERTGQTALAKADRTFLQREQVDAFNDTIFRDKRK